MDGSTGACYCTISVSRRFLSAIFVVALALAHAGAASAALPLPGRTLVGAPGEPALGPGTRPSLQIGRNVDARLPLPLPLALPSCVPVDASTPLAPRWIRLRQAHPLAPQLPSRGGFGRSTRGPPAHDSSVVES
jgi:hypothetical protein